MKTFFWIAIISLNLAALAVNPASSSNSNSSPEQKECDCSNLKTLQAELRNAIRLRQNYQNEVAVLRGMDLGPSQAAFKQFAEGPAKTGIEPVPGYAGPDSFVYTGRGEGFADPAITHPASEQCEMTMGTKADYQRLLSAAACAGIARALQAHEEFHMHKCVSLGGWQAYFSRHGAEKAQEEVDAYTAEIGVLRAEIAKVLQKAELHVIVEVNTRLQMPSNPLYTAINISNKADIPMNPPTSVGDDSFRFEGAGSQETNGSIEGNCRFTSGLPSTLPAHATVETDLVDAKVSYNAEGTSGSMSMECQVGGRTGRAMSFPVPIKGDNKGDFTLVFENGATKEFDQGSGQAAQIMASSGARMSGKGIVKLVFCNSNK